MTPPEVRDGCGYCPRPAGWLVSRDVPGGTEMLACNSHLTTAAANVMRTSKAVSVTLRPLGPNRALADGQESTSVADVLKRVRQVGALSMDDEAAHSAEDALHLAVLAMIAQGAEQPSALAAAALQTQNYGFERFWS